MLISWSSYGYVASLSRHPVSQTRLYIMWARLLNAQLIELVLDAPQHLALDSPLLQRPRLEEELQDDRRVGQLIDAEHLRVVEDERAVPRILTQLPAQREQHFHDAVDIFAVSDVDVEER